MRQVMCLALVLAGPAVLTLAAATAAQPRAVAPPPARATAPAPAAEPSPAPRPGPTREDVAEVAPGRGATPAPKPVEPPPVSAWSSLDDARATIAATRVARWIAATQDNGTLPYMIIDKSSAALFVFDADGELQGESPVLIGVATGDDSSPGVGSKDLAKIGPAERTTPAGRFVSRYGEAAGGETVLWVDWSTSVALHAVVTGNRRERRLERLLTPSPDDNRITFGCINVPTNFYVENVRPLFRRAGGVVYVLPDSKPLETVFPGVLVSEAGGARRS